MTIDSENPLGDTRPPGKHSHRLSGELARLSALCQSETVTLGRIIGAMGTRGHALLSLFLGLPFLLPIPLPGLSLFFGSCIAIAGVRMAIGRAPWFPKTWMEKPLSTKVLVKIFQSGEKVMRRLESWIKPRGAFFHKYPGVRTMNGAMIAVCGFLLALPLPPGTNFPPATAIILLSIGSLEEDGLFLILGYIAFALNIAFFTLLPILGFHGIRALWA